MCISTKPNDKNRNYGIRILNLIIKCFYIEYIYVYPNDSAEREKPCNQYKNQTVFHSGVIFPEPPGSLAKSILAHESDLLDLVLHLYPFALIGWINGTGGSFLSRRLVQSCMLDLVRRNLNSIYESRKDFFELPSVNLLHLMFSTIPTKTRFRRHYSTTASSRL